MGSLKGTRAQEAETGQPPGQPQEKIQWGKVETEDDHDSGQNP